MDQKREVRNVRLGFYKENLLTNGVRVTVFVQTLFGWEYIIIATKKCHM